MYTLIPKSLKKNYIGHDSQEGREKEVISAIFMRHKTFLSLLIDKYIKAYSHPRKVTAVSTFPKT